MLHQFRNNQSLINLSDNEWSKANAAGLLNIIYQHVSDGYLIDQHGHKFINMISCSYLGLDINTQILEGATTAVNQSQTLIMGSSRLRIHPKILNEAETELSNLFQAPILTTISCGVAACGVLPLISSGHITDTGPVVTVFDKHAHFTMNIAKPICAEETKVITIAHNDLNALEDICKQHKHVAYVCDGIYSMGDKAPLDELLYLQNKYGLFLYIDDSHAISVYGQSGEGFAKMHIGELNDKIMIVGSLWKGFGARGCALMVGAKHKLELIKRHGGGYAWSQYLTTADCGAILASALLHQSPLLAQLQQQLQKNITLFDSLIPNSQAGTNFPIRVIRFGKADTAIEKSYKLYQAGFYASAVFFPVVEKNQAGLRFMARADLSEKEIIRFAHMVNALNS